MATDKLTASIHKKFSDITSSYWPNNTFSSCQNWMLLNS